MSHLVIKQEWQKVVPGMPTEVKHSIHLNQDLVEVFVEMEMMRSKALMEGFERSGNLETLVVNDEIYDHLCKMKSHGMWLEEQSKSEV